MTVFRTITCVAALFLLSSCAKPDVVPDGSIRRFAEIIGGYPQTDGELRIPRLNDDTVHAVRPGRLPHDIFIIVHPGYTFFFKSGMKEQHYRGAKFRMQELQFSMETRFIAERAKAGNLVILIVPGDYYEDSIAPRSYVSYLNAAAGTGPAVFYLPSVTSSNGNIASSDMVTLYQFLEAVEARKILLGGGYVGRCQREFYGQLTTFLDRDRVFIVSEGSTLSPEDVTEREASRIASAIERSDYQQLNRYIMKKLEDNENVVSILPGRRPVNIP